MVELGVPKCHDPKWVLDLEFLVDSTQELRILNLKLKGPCKLITVAYGSMKVFSTKLRFQPSVEILNYFKECRSLVEDGRAISGDECASAKAMAGI